MNNTLTNIVTSLGTYNGLPTSLTSTPVVTTLLTGLSLVKSVDKQIWADGELTYTITIVNQALLPYIAPVITDIINPALAKLVPGSIKINGVTATAQQFTYDTLTGTLTIPLQDIVSNGTSIIVFKVAK